MPTLKMSDQSLGLLRKSVAVNSREMRVFNVAESREVTLSNGKIVQKLRP